VGRLPDGRTHHALTIRNAWDERLSMMLPQGDKLTS